MGIPRALASLERAMMHPSLLESTTTGRPRSEGNKETFAGDVEVVAVY